MRRPSFIPCALILSLIALLTLPLIAAPTAAQIIQEYEKAQSALNSRHVMSESLTEIIDTANPGKKWVKYALDSRSDGKRYDVVSMRWGLDRPNAPTTDDKALVHHVLWDGTTCYEYHEPTGGNPKARFLAVTRDLDFVTRRFFSADQDRLLIGFVGGDFQPISSIIRAAQRVELRPQPELVANVACHVLNVISKERGDYTIWIDPQHGHNIARVKLHKGPGQLFFNRPLPQPGDIVGPDQVLEYSISLDNVRFEKFGSTWLPMSADFERLTIAGSKDGIYIERGHHQRTRVEIAPPDLDAPDAFRPIFPDGLRVFDMQNQSAPPRKWRDGKIVAPDDEKKP